MRLTLWNRLVSTFSARQSDAELQEEIATHLDLATDDLMAAGMSEAQARREARVRFGGVTQTQEAYRQTRGWPLASSVFEDLRFAVRQFARSPKFFAVAALTLAVGIGATTAIYSLLDSILLKPLPFAKQEELVKVSGFYPKGWIRAAQRQSRSYSALMAYRRATEQNVEGATAPERVFGAEVTVNGFEVLGVTPRLGRFFETSEEVAGQDKVVVLSEGYWRQRFNGDEAVVGRMLRVDGVARMIVGVMPEGIHFPDANARFWVPISTAAGNPIDPWAQFNCEMIGRLRDGVQPGQALAEMRTLHPQFLKMFPWPMPDKWNADATVTPLLDSVVKDARPKLVLLLSGVGLVLLIACANVANLMLARAATRSRELAVRIALGATMRRVTRQMLTESLLLGLVAGALGVGIAATALRGLKMLLPIDTPRLAETGLRGGSLVFVAVLIVETSLVFGLAPAWRLRSLRVQEALKGSGTNQTASREQFRVSSALVVAQVALAVTVLTCAGIMMHSLWRLIHVDPGFRSANLVTALVSLEQTSCGEAQHESCGAFYRQLLERARAIPGAQQVALVDGLPLRGYDEAIAYDTEDHPRIARQTPDQGSNRTVSSSYFQMLGIRLLQGRLFTDADNDGVSRAVVVNEEMARRYWPAGDAVGKRLEWLGYEHVQGRLDDRALRVVGVVSDTRHEALETAPGVEMYTPLAPSFLGPEMSLVVRSPESATAVAAEIRSMVAGMNAGAAVSNLSTVDALIVDSTRSFRSLVVLLVAFSGLALGVGLVGVYSLIAYQVSCRTRDLGLRLALGATRGQVVGLVLRQGLVLGTVGCGIGLVLAAAASRVLRGFLFATSAFDPATFAFVPVLLMMLVAAAALWPAWKAAQIEPMEALRAD